MTMAINSFHVPVMLNEAIEYLQIKKGEKYIDCTLGGGGHSGRIVELDGKVLSIDQDDEAINYVVQKFQVPNPKFQTNSKSENSNNKIIKIKDNWSIIKGNFANIEQIAKENDFMNVSGVLFDLGVSSHQLESDERGFSFHSDLELDMRMDKDLGVKASALVNGLSQRELERIFKELGEESSAWAISREIEKARKIKPIITCDELAQICIKAGGNSRLRFRSGEAKHAATKVFQALRIQINDELGSLEAGLIGAFNILKKSGRIVTISFHSLEDRIVKKYFAKLEMEKKGKNVVEKPLTPTEDEVKINVRARSAKLRVFEKYV